MSDSLLISTNRSQSHPFSSDWHDGVILERNKTKIQNHDSPLNEKFIYTIHALLLKNGIPPSVLSKSSPLLKKAATAAHSVLKSNALCAGSIGYQVELPELRIADEEVGGKQKSLLSVVIGNEDAENVDCSTGDVENERRSVKSQANAVDGPNIESIDAPTEVKKDSRHRKYWKTKQIIEAPDDNDRNKLQEILSKNTIEYNQLFQANQPFQTETTQISELKTVEFLFQNLAEFSSQMETLLEKSLNEEAKKLMYEMIQKTNDHVNWLNQNYLRIIRRIQHAHRTKLSDTIMQIAQNAMNQQKILSENMERNKSNRRNEIEHKLYNLKRTFRKRSDEISKLRNQVAKYQILMRKHSIHEFPGSHTDEKVKSENIMESYQSTIQVLDEKILETTLQIAKLEDFLSCNTRNPAGKLGSTGSLLGSRDSIKPLSTIRSSRPTSHHRTLAPIRAESDDGIGNSSRLNNIRRTPQLGPVSSSRRDTFISTPDKSRKQTPKLPNTIIKDDLKATREPSPPDFSEKIEEMLIAKEQILETKMNYLLEGHETACRTFQEETESMERMFEQEFEELKVRIMEKSGDENQKFNVLSNQKTLLRLARRIYPIEIKEKTDFVDVEIQCDLND
ncbi:hypothetical protein HK098_002120 [Nowakowskiella sp. JEL0407]|nr:hypothetical protein HK098_002120 [Nowakowskiella sp. JEL0407]